MRIPRARLLIVAAAVSVAVPASAREIPRQQTRAVTMEAAGSVRFDLYRGYFTVVHGSAGPLKNLNFFIDTGTSPTIVDSQVAKKLHLHGDESTRIAILGGMAPGEMTNVPSLKIGPVQRMNLKVVVTDLSFFRKAIPVRIDAIVGLDVLGQRPFVIDYSARAIRFGESPALAVSLPLRLDQGLAVFDAVIGDRPVHLLLDTGASSLVLFTKNVPQGTGSKADAVLEEEEIGNFQSKQVRLRRLRLGSAEFRKKPALVTVNPKPSQFDFDGLISPVALGLSRVAVNVAEGTLAFSR